ncbi:retention module-containing protein [Neptuniibacter sp. QD37_11]|uniref:retention module-containing protein n=1 Tax=Neptuniibacter sp. QD37_11 TaxID=3398209 RepID=UPI0039F4C20F
MNVIGTVSLLIGNVVAVKADGTERLLSLGEEVYADEMIRVAPDASIEIAMDAGEPVRLDGGQNWLANAETYTESNNFDLSEATADVESIQAAILAGADPTAVSEATAAGGDTQAGGEGNEGSSTVNIERTAEEVDPNAGYETVGFTRSDDTLEVFEGSDEQQTSEAPEADPITYTFKLFVANEDGSVSEAASEISEEGETSAYYVVLAVGEDGQPLADEDQPTGTVDVRFTNNGETSDDDYTISGTQATIGTVFSSTASNDALADNGETFTVSLVGNYSEEDDYEAITYDEATVTTTIIDETSNDPDNTDDNDSAYTFKLFAANADGSVSEAASEISEEGETSAYYVVLAVGEDGQPLVDEDQPTGTVDVRFTNNGETSDDDYTVSGTEATIGEAFSSTASNDALADNGETFTVALVGNYSEEGEYEAITYDAATVTTTITDVDAAVTFAINSTPSISEELEETATFTVTLGGDPLVAGNTASVAITPSGDATSDEDYSDFVTAITTAANNTPGVSYSNGTLTFDSTFTGSDFSFDVSAINDDNVEGTETITATLSGESVDHGSASITTASTDTEITELDAAVTFAINSTPSISEELEETATFTVTLGGDPLVAGNTASVAITPSGDATSDEDYSDFVTAITTAANNTQGVSYSNGTLTFDSTFTGSDFSFDVSAINDDNVEGTETITATLSGESVDHGSASITTASTDTEITELDAAVTFAINSTPSISEELEETATFTVTLGGDPLVAGNTASVAITPSGDATSDEDYSDFVTAITTAANNTQGVSYSNGTLTFDSTFTGSDFSFDVSAINDDNVEGTETITATLSGESVDHGSASITTASTDTEITELDAAVTFAINSTPSISEELEETATFTVTLGGDPLVAGNTASVAITPSGDATSDEDYSDFVTAITTAANNTQGVSYSNGTLTFDSTFTGPDFSFDVSAINDDNVEGTETITATLSGESVDLGSVSITTASTDTEITELDAAVTFAINSTPSISEELEETATFTVTLGGDPLVAGNTASVAITPSGDATSDEDYSDFVTAITTAANNTPGVSYSNGTLTFDSTFTGSDFSFDVSAINDDNVEGTETITATLSGESVDHGSASITTASTDTEITELDAAVTFAINSTPSISEELEETATFTVTLGGDPLVAGNTASVAITPSGDATSDEDYSDFVTAITTAANNTQGVSYSNGTLTFDSTFTGSDFSFDVSAINDDNVEGTETITATLSGESVDHGSASITTASTDTEITELDAAVTFAINSTPSISEELEETATFTVTLGGDPLVAGNTASVAITPSGDATSDEDYSDFVTAITTAANNTQGVSYSNGTLTFDSTFTGSDFSFDVSAINDDNVEGTETITATLSGESVDHGSASITTASTDTEITELDAAVTFAINSTPSISEELEETATFTVTLGGDPLVAGNTASVAITPSGDATSDEDYSDFVTAITTAANNTQGVSYSNGTLTFDSTFTGSDFSFDVSAINDDNVEGTETITATLSGESVDHGSASITTASTDTEITELDAVVTFAINSTPSISEELEETATFTVTLGGDPLVAGNTASVAITPSGDATSDEDYSDFVTAITTAANNTQGVSYSNGTLTFDSTFTGSDFSFDVSAINDDNVEGTETITATLSGESVDHGSASITTASTDTEITELDAAVTFAINSTPSISEELEETATFTVTLGGDPLVAGNTASVAITPSGDATSDEDYSDFVTAITTAANNTQGVSYSNGTLTFDSTFTGSDFSFDVSAINDDNVEGTETITATLSGESVDHGSASITTASTDTEITELDAAVTFAINSTPSISEELEETATFTVTLGGDPLVAGNTASVAITPSGDATSDEDYSDFVTAITTAANNTQGVSYSNGTLTFDSTFTGSDFSFDVSAINDDNVEGTETITATLSGESVDHGSASITTASTDTEITELDAAVTFAINSTPSISEELEETATFTVTLGGDPLVAGNTASVAITPSGDATSDEDYSDFVTAITTAANNTQGVSYSNGTLTFDSTFTGSDFSFDVSAINDDNVEGTETITATLSGESVDHGSASITTASTDTEITELDAAVTFAINSTPSISEELEETATFTVTLGGDPLVAGNTASVAITPSGDATSDEDYSDFVTAITTAANNTQGVSYSNGTLTFDSTFTGSDFSFDVSAINDDNVEGTETITATLSGESVDHGSASITTASTDTEITELDAAVTFAINSTPSISEELEETATFTVTLGGDPLVAGNTASVAITPSGDATSDEDYSDFVTAITTAANNTQGVSYSNGTLTFDSTFTGSDFSFDVSAINDDNVEGTETITATLSGESVDHGSASITTASTDTEITELDAAVTFAINSTPSISEELEETATFTVTLGGDPLVAGNTASVAITPSGDATSDEDYSDFVTAITTAANNTQGVSYSNGTLTFDSTFTGSDFSFDVSAINDDNDEGTETITATLSGESVDHGSASITTASTDTEITDADFNAPPAADDVSTQSNLSTDSLDANFPIGNYAFIKKIDIGGGLDGDLSVAENDETVGGDPADLGGSDLETAEDSLIFSIDSLPNYGDIYLLQDGSYIKLDASEIQSDQFSTSDTLYWVAEHDQVLESTGSTISFDFTQGFDAVAASSAGLDVIAYGLDGTQSSVTQINNDGLGVDSGSDDRINQIEYADGNTETLLFDFDQPVTNATIGVTHLINSESGGEIGVVHAYLDGALVGTWTFTASSTAVADFSPSNGNVDTTSIGNNNGTGSASFTLSDIAFDQLRFVGTEYQNENSPSDSSDYYVASLAYDLVDDVSFTYSVEDEKGLTSSSATVAIDVNSDTPVPTDLSSTVKPSVFEDVKEVEESLLASSSPVIVSGNLLANDNLLGIDSELTHIDGIRVDPTGITVITTDIGELTVYTDDFNGRLAGDYDYELTSTTDEGVNDIDQFAYTVTNVNGAEASTNLTIRVIDDVPVAVNDSDAVIDTSVVVEGNVLSNDYLSVDVDNKVTSVNGNPVSPSGDTVIQGAYGALTIDANGEYSYEYNATSETIRVKVNDTQGAVISAYSDTESSFAFDLYNADGSLNLNPTIQSDVSVSTHGSASANKQGYGVADNNGAATLDNGEYLVYELSKAVSGSFTFVIGQYNANQTDPTDIQWQAFAADGSLITYGDMSGGQSVSNGTYTGSAEGISGEVKYLVFTITDPSGQGITLTEISYDYYPTGIDSFEYEIEDADGDTSSAVLNITSDDYLVGDSLDNVLVAGDGDDILIGQAGNDILTGGEGEDLFVWSKSDLGVDNAPAADQIVDFNTSENDVIDLSDVLSDGSHVISAVENVDGNLQLQITDASSSNVVQTIDLNNVAADTDVAAQLQQLLDNNNIDDGIN